MPAPAGYWKFDVLAPTAIGEEGPAEQMLNAFPNPSKGITCIPLILSASEKITASLTDVNGRTVANIYDGFLNKGEQKLFVNTENVAAGVYLISVNGSQSNHHQKLIVK